MQAQTERNLTNEEIAAYQRDGVAHVRGAIAPRWIDTMLKRIDARMKHVGQWGGDTNPGGTEGRFLHDRYMWPEDEGFRDFSFNSGIARLAAQAMGSRKTQLYFDQIFVKEPQTSEKFFWHQDLPYWPMGGNLICSIWVTLYDVDVESSGLEFVKGTDKLKTLYKPVFPEGTLNGDLKEWLGNSPMPDIPDFDAERDRHEMLSFDMKAGDALIFNTRIVHSSRGNAHKTRRRVAISTRWLGDDAIWDPRPGTDPIVLQEHVSIQPGELTAHDEHRFPTVYRAT
ncbi:MAG: phytanoyl-CoA dioxygenase family protein [Panacagrimonas sp.]